MNIPELIDYLKDRSRVGHPGIMGTEVYVKKEPLRLAAVHLEDYLLLMEQVRDDKAIPEYEKLKERDGAILAKDKYDFSGFYIGECPSCGTAIDSKSNFCFNCGQRIDWTEQEEDHEN